MQTRKSGHSCSFSVFAWLQKIFFSGKNNALQKFAQVKICCFTVNLVLDIQQSPYHPCVASCFASPSPWCSVSPLTYEALYLVSHDPLQTQPHWGIQSQGLYLLVPMVTITIKCNTDNATKPLMSSLEHTNWLHQKGSCHFCNEMKYSIVPSQMSVLLF